MGAQLFDFQIHLQLLWCPHPLRDLAQAVWAERRALLSQDSPLLSPPHFTPDFFPTIEKVYPGCVESAGSYSKKITSMPKAYHSKGTKKGCPVKSESRLGQVAQLVVRLQVRSLVKARTRINQCMCKYEEQQISLSLSLSNQEKINKKKPTRVSLSPYLPVTYFTSPETTTCDQVFSLFSQRCPAPV